MGLKINFLLIQPRCQISKGFTAKAYHVIYLRTVPSRQIITNSNQPSRRVTQVRNRDKINHLPLIFIWLHSEDINLLNTCLFSLIKSLSISKNLIINIKGKQERCTLGIVHEKALGHCRVHSFRLLLLPNFSEYKPETISKDC